jgi:hypothetical protein
LEARVARGVVGVAEDVLAQLVETVEGVTECDVLGLVCLGVFNVAEEGSLGIGKQKEEEKN